MELINITKNGYSLDINNLNITDYDDVIQSLDLSIRLSIIDTVNFTRFNELPIDSIKYSTKKGYQDSIMSEFKRNYREFQILLYSYLDENKSIRFQLKSGHETASPYWNLIGFARLHVDRVVEMFGYHRDVDLRKVMEHDLFRIENVINREVFTGKLYKVETCKECQNNEKSLICVVSPLFGREWENNGLFSSFSNDIREKLELT